MTVTNYNNQIYIKKYLLLRLNFKHINLGHQLYFNMTHKAIINSKKNLGFLLLGMKLITGLKPRGTFAKSSIATFKLKEHMAIGCKSYIINNKVLDFIYKLKTCLLPTLNDFNTHLKKNFDKNNNYNSGLSDITLFPEINYSFEYFDKIMGMNFGYFQYKKNKIINLNKLIISAFELPFFHKSKI